MNRRPKRRRYVLVTRTAEPVRWLRGEPGASGQSAKAPMGQPHGVQPLSGPADHTGLLLASGTPPGPAPFSAPDIVIVMAPDEARQYHHNFSDQLARIDGRVDVLSANEIDIAQFLAGAVRVATGKATADDEQALFEKLIRLVDGTLTDIAALKTLVQDLMQLVHLFRRHIRPSSPGGISDALKVSMEADKWLQSCGRLAEGVGRYNAHVRVQTTQHNSKETRRELLIDYDVQSRDRNQMLCALCNVAELVRQIMLMLQNIFQPDEAAR